MVVADDELDAVQAALAESGEERVPAAAALAAGEFDAEDVAAAVPADADGDQHRLGVGDAVLAHLLVAGVEDVGLRPVELPPGEGGEGPAEPRWFGKHRATALLTFGTLTSAEFGLYAPRECRVAVTGCTWRSASWWWHTGCA